jgi:serine/threonine protein kinase
MAGAPGLNSRYNTLVRITQCINASSLVGRVFADGKQWIGLSMDFGEIVIGQRQRWMLKKKLGEGDAGEVHLVESLLDQKPAILKRPYSNGTASQVLRQATQILREAQILKSLSSLAFSGDTYTIHTPAVLDQSQVGSEFSGGLFIVIEKAAGIDLNALARLARYGRGAGEFSAGEGEFEIPAQFLDILEREHEIPDLLLLRVLHGIIVLFENMHFAETSKDGEKKYGLIWNDVKSEHLFWDAENCRLTVVDWGNGQFLEADGGAVDRQSSRMDDYVQFMQEMRRFLQEVKPILLEKTNWPSEVNPGNAFSEGIKPVRDAIESLMAQEQAKLEKYRRAEKDLATTSTPDLEHFQRIIDLQDNILACGELPEYTSATGLSIRLLTRLAEKPDFPNIHNICEITLKWPVRNRKKWQLIAWISDLASDEEQYSPDVYERACLAAINEDWPRVSWEFFLAIRDQQFPNWWEDLNRRLRHLQFGISNDVILPYVIVTRTFFTMQAIALKQEKVGQQQGFSFETQVQPVVPDEFLRLFEEEVVQKWKDIEPPPPNSGVGYGEIEQNLEQIEIILPGSSEALRKGFSQLNAQAEIILDAWQRKEFEKARRGIRQLLLLDPHRRRLLTTDRALQYAPQWLAALRSGARSDELFQDYLTQTELKGRDLRNQVGSARWLDLILDTLKSLRTGARPADLMMLHPEILIEIPWINEHRSRETLNLPGMQPLNLERLRVANQPIVAVRSAHDGEIGRGKDLVIEKALDSWIPEARGSSARVFDATLRDLNGQAIPCALKIMRSDRKDYAPPLFREEVQILTILRDVPGVIQMIECGFILLESGALPAEDEKHSAAQLKGKIIRFGIEQVPNFLTTLDNRIGQGWLPYIAMEKWDQKNNLMVYCDSSHTHGRFLPLRESLLLAIQICDILHVAHDRNIVYRDHKLLHYYWHSQSQGVGILDWNISKRYPQGLTDGERQFDLVQFGARALYHILTGRTAPGALPLGPNRPEEIEQAAHHYSAQWTYDDERLPNQIKGILEKALGEGYLSVKDLRQDLFEIYKQLPQTDQ